MFNVNGVILLGSILMLFVIVGCSGEGTGVRNVESCIGDLADAEKRDLAMDRLVNAGETAVDPIIEKIKEGWFIDSDGDALVEVLQRIGQPAHEKIRLAIEDIEAEQEQLYGSSEILALAGRDTPDAMDDISTALARNMRALELLRWALGDVDASHGPAGDLHIGEL